MDKAFLQNCTLHLRVNLSQDREEETGRQNPSQKMFMPASQGQEQICGKWEESGKGNEEAKLKQS